MNQASTCQPPWPSAPAAMARPETIETSCSADGPPSRTTSGGRAPEPVPAGGWASVPVVGQARLTSCLPARPVAREDDLEAQLDARLAADDVPHRLGQPAHVGRRARPVVDDEVGVLLRDDRAADAAALEAEGIDDGAGRADPRRVAEDAAGRRLAERLVGLPPAPDRVEPFRDQRRLGRLPDGSGPRSRCAARRVERP